MLTTVPIQAKDPAEVAAVLKKKQPAVQVYEIWLDHLKRKYWQAGHVAEMVSDWRKITQKKLVVVCKDRSERGLFEESDRTRADLLIAAAQSGADFIDVPEYLKLSELKRVIVMKKKARLILSHHDFEQTPPLRVLESRSKRMFHLGADVVKIATMVHCPEDNEALMTLALDLKKARLKHVVLGMGQLGVMTRVFAGKMGNELNFVTLESKTAPGQLSLEQMLKLEKLLR